MRMRIDRLRTEMLPLEVRLLDFYIKCGKIERVSLRYRIWLKHEVLMQKGEGRWTEQILGRPDIAKRQRQAA